MDIYNIIDKIKKAPKKDDKIYILKTYDSPELREILNYVYNINITYGVKKIVIPKTSSVVTLFGSCIDPMIPEEEQMDLKCIESASNKNYGMNLLRNLLDSLNKREITGAIAKEEISHVLKHFDVNSQLVIKMIFERKLGGGFSANTINKAFPGLIPVFDVALAERYDKMPHVLTFDKTWFASRKLDGCRNISIVDGMNVKYNSRQGIAFTTLSKCNSELINLALKIKATNNIDPLEPLVFDGEICVVDANGDEDFTGIMKLIKKKNFTIEKPKYKIFDVLTLTEFKSKTSNKILSERYKMLNNSFEKGNSEYIDVLEQTVLESSEQFAEMNTLASDSGWEGLIVRKDTLYEGSRSKNLLKVKKFFDAEYVVQETNNGVMNYAVAGAGNTEEEMMRSVTIMHKGQEVKVGSGWSRKQRQEYFQHPEDIIGKTITVSYFEETTNKKGTISLRFPTVKYVYDGERDV